MSRRDTRPILRRLGIVVSILFGLFLLLDVALFGWLITSSLSQREIERVLLETREELEPLAAELVAAAVELGQDDLYVVLSVAEETRTFLGSVLQEREILSSIEVRDKEDRVVYRTSSQESTPLAEGLSGGELAEPSGREAEVPIGDLGVLVIGVSEEELQRRIGVLREDLVRQASLVGVFTMTLLGVALAMILALFRRAARLEEQAVEAERLAYVGTLASGLAHEIRNPLNALNLNMQMLEEEVYPGGTERRNLSASSSRLFQITRSEISRLEDLVTDFLSYARPRALELEEATAAELFEKLLEVVGRELEACGVDVRVEDRSAGARVLVDRDQIGQLLLNLTQNALAATSEVDREGRVVLGAECRPHQLLLSVADNGRGIPEETRSRIFELFYSTRKGGTGLGLSIVERIARSHGAEVEVASVSGEGTTVRLRLPLTVKSRASSPP